MSKVPLYAVYGTLRKGFGNHAHYIPNCKLVSTEEVKGYRLYNLGGYPGIKKGEGKVVVEIYEVPDPRAERALDRLEGVGHNFYDRETINTSQGEATIYVYCGEVNERNFIENGDYMQFCSPRTN